jgi:hypothetical protein
MVQPIDFSLNELPARTDPTEFVASNAVASTNRAVSPTPIEDNVTLSPEALAATRPSNLLTFASPNNADLSSQATDTTALYGQSQIQNLLYEGYSLSQIASEFNLPLAAATQSALGIHTFDAAA